MKIDSHHHIWDLSVTPQDWIDRDLMAAIYQNFSTSDLRKEIVGTGIEKTVLVQTVTNYDETPLLLALAEKDDLVAGVVGWLDIDSKDAISHLEDYLTLPGAGYLKSIRDIAQRVAQSGVLAAADQAELEYIGLELFEVLWRMDFIAIDLTAAAA